ncbi:MAG: 23S rRNA (pseudouridine(1915)-N(3))-methyltransferase RlmH, partial [Bacillota bacterium]|nr:23S rRNA (pseudouridine(1915)-N(3))-methyltransferase RlmH [Bacillota bacterium]
AKRLKPHLKLEILEGPEENAPDNISPGEIGVILSKEGKFFLDKMKEGDYNIALDLDGKALTSPEIAQTVEAEAMMKGKTVNFLIGGSLGIAREVKDKCHLKISFGRATFPHQLIRVFVVEQIYRAVKIIRHEPYHK